MGYFSLAEWDRPPTMGRMKEIWRTRLRDVIEQRKLPLKKLSLSAGLNETFLRDVLKDGSTPTISKLQAVTDALGLPLSYLFGAEDPPQIAIPVVGYVSGGDEWFPDGGNVDHLDFALPNDHHICVRVRGHSMSPVYRDGDDLLCEQVFGAQIAKAVNKDCAVRTADNRGYIKRLLKGTERGSFRLRSYNPAFEDIDNVALEWAAPVIWVRRHDG